MRERHAGRRRILCGAAALLLLAACRAGVQKADAYESLADQLIGNKAYPAAIEALNKATRYDSNEPRRWLKLGRTWRALDNPALSAISYQRALDLDPANLEALQNLAVLLVRAGRYDEAKQYTGPLLMLAPNDPGGLLATGAIAFYEKRYLEADRIAGQIIDLAPTISDGYVLRGRTLEALGHPDRAVRLLAQRLALDPDNLDLATQVLQLYRRIGDLGGIRRTALVLARLQPDVVSYQMEAARAHHAAGEDAEAERILADLVARYPGSPGINQAVAEYWLTVLPADAAAARIADMAGKVHGRARARLAETLIGMGRAAAALRVLAPEASGPVTADNLDVRAEYARALLAAGQVDAANAEALEAMSFDQTDTAMLVLAEVALRKRDYAGGLNAAQSVVDNDPDNEEAALLIARLHDAAGNSVLARKAFGDAQAAIPDSVAVMRGYAEWLVAHDAPDDAVSVASQFARAHPRSIAARTYQDELCRRLKTAACRQAVLVAGRTVS